MIKNQDQERYLVKNRRTRTLAVLCHAKRASMIEAKLTLNAKEINLCIHMKCSTRAGETLP